MPRLAQIDRAGLRSLNAAIAAALASVGAEYGVVLKPGSASFTPTHATLKLSIALVQSDGSVETKEAKAFRTQASRFGLAPAMLGKTFTHGGRSFKVTGLNTRAPKMPVLAEQMGTGKMYKFPVDYIQRAMPDLRPR